MQPDASLYMAFSNVIKNCFGLSPFGKHVIISCLCVIESFPFQYGAIFKSGALFEQT